jgi:hypothetical protein
VIYQPVPFSWKEVLEISRLTFALQVGHLAKGFSVIR